MLSSPGAALFMVIMRKIWFGARPTPAQLAVGGCLYAILVFISLVMSAIIWSAEADNKLFVCTDSMGAPFDFIPPFVHNCCGDHYVASPLLVWAFWGSLVAGSIVLPGVAVLLIAHFGEDEH
jgi:hypothetical protein